MVAYAYEARPVVDPSTGTSTLVPNATFQFYAYSDNTFVTPLTVRTMVAGAMTAVTSMASNANGILDEFEVDDQWRVWAKSGSHTVLMTSTQGLADAAEAARVAAVAAQGAAESAAQDAADAAGLTTEQIDTYMGGTAANLVPVVEALDTGKADLDPITGKVVAAQLPPQSDITRVTLTGPYTLTPDAAWDQNTGQVVVLTQDATGGRTVSFASSVKVADGDSLPSVALVSGAETWLGFTWSPALAGWIPTLLYTATPPDTTPPTAGTLSSASVNTGGFTLNVVGASDARGLHAQPYSFSTDGGTTWSAWQTAASFVASGLVANTAYAAKHRVRDAAGNVSVGTGITVTTSAGFSLAYVSHASTAGDGAVFTAPGLSLGPAAADRQIRAVVQWRAGSAVTLTSATIAGLAATIEYQTNQNTSSGVAIIRASVPSGTTGDVVLNFSGTMVRAGVALYRTSGGTVTVSGAGAAGATSATVTVPAGGFALAGAFSSTPTLSGVTQDQGDAQEGYYFLSGRSQTAGAVTPTTSGVFTAVAALAYSVA